MLEITYVLIGCFAAGVFMLMLLDPSHESCKPEVKR
jgi:hypothetical protein